MERITPPKIEVTRDYSIFKQLEGNREATDKRAAKIAKSIRKVGYVPCPIVVNEKYEVIDGNGRFKAIKNLGLHVYYIVVPGLTIEHCVAMNINSTNWTNTDFINSYAEQGNRNYVSLKYLMEKHPHLSPRIILAAATNAIGGSDNSTIKNGTLTIDQSKVFFADEILTWIDKNFVPIKNCVNGRFETLMYALIFAYKWSTADMNRLTETVIQYKNDLPPATNVKYTLEQLSKLYNKNMKKNFVYLNAEYDKFCAENLFGHKFTGRGASA